VTYSVPSPGIPVNHLGKLRKVEEGYPDKGECLEEVGHLEGVDYLVQGGDLEQVGRQKRLAVQVQS